MAIDFEEEEEPKLTLAICSQHNLKYDPEVTWGCVLCRSSRKKRVSGYWVVLGIFAVALGIYLLLPVIRPTQEPALSAMVTVSDRSTDSEANMDPAVSCLLKVSNGVEECIAKAEKSSSNARLDKEFCLDKLRAENSGCTEEQLAQDYLAAPLYKINRIPDWEKVREPLEYRQDEIETCVGDADYDFAVRITVDRATGKASDVTLSLFGLDTSERFCLYKFFESVAFPTAQAKAYTFVTQIQACALALNKPNKEQDQNDEFKKFVEEQRNAKLTEERHAEIMKRRREFDKKFQPGANSNE